MRYSQNNEEELIVNHFGLKFVGTCLDLGANDGKTLSNTRACIERGWSAVLVEPSPTAFPKLLELYEGEERVECHNVAVGVSNGVCAFHNSGQHLGNGDSGLLSTMVVAEMDRWGSTATFTTEQVECLTFQSLLKCSEHAHFDLISIDIEGLDLFVLQQMDLNALGCRMLIVEYNGRNESAFRDYVLPFGFSLRAKNAENLIYTK